MRTAFFSSVLVFPAAFFLFFGATPVLADSSCDEILSTFRREIYKADADFQKQAAAVWVRIGKQRRRAICAAARTAIQRLESMEKTAEQKGDTATADQATQAMEQVEKVRNSASVPVPMSRVKLASYKGRQYLAVVAHISFHDARKACRQMGGRLAYIETRDELRFLIKLISHAEKLWVGATDRQKEGKWLWLNGVPVKEELWRKGEPNNWAGEHYAITGGEKLYDAGHKESDKFRGFICEWEPGSRYAKVAPALASVLKEIKPNEEFEELKVSEQVAEEFHDNESNYSKKIGNILKQFFASAGKADHAYQKKYGAIKKLQDKRLQLIERAETNALDCLKKQTASDSVEKVKKEVREFAQQAKKPIRVNELYRVHFQGSSYLNVLSPVTWRQAREICESMGGHLAYIETIEERDFLTDTILLQSTPWVGATDKHKEGDWRWLNRKPVSKNLWKDMEPNGGKRENAARFCNGQIHDAPESRIQVRAIGFICEWD